MPGEEVPVAATVYLPSRFSEDVMPGKDFPLDATMA